MIAGRCAGINDFYHSERNNIFFLLLALINTSKYKLFYSNIYFKLIFVFCMCLQEQLKKLLCRPPTIDMRFISPNKDLGTVNPKELFGY